MARALHGLALALALACAPAGAQLPAELMERPAQEFLREALASPYGRLISGEFGDLLRKSADPACIKQKDLDPRAMDSRAREILERRGAQMLDTLRRAHDGGRFEASFLALGGASARGDYLRLRADPAVARLLEINQPARQARIIDRVAENVDRFALLNRIALQGRIAPLSSGNQRLLDANPEERAEAAETDYLNGHDTPALRRWLELQQAFQQAMGHARQTEGMLRLGPSQMMAGLERDLAELCVPRLR